MTVETIARTPLTVAAPARTEAGERALLGAAIQAEIASIRNSLESATSLLAGLAGTDVLGAGTAQLDSLAAQRIPRWHFPMLNDAERNDAYATGLGRAIRPGDIVLDIGSGTGLLAMLAAQAGAGHVYTCEADPLMAEVARNVIAANGLADDITVLSAMSSELVVGRDIPCRVDLIVTEIVDCGLIGEGILPTVRHARRELLKPGGSMIPTSARVHGALLESAAARRLNAVTTAGGFDIGTLNRVSTVGHFPLRMDTWPHTILSRHRTLLTFDLLADELGAGSAIHNFPVTTSGQVDGVVAWFEMELGPGNVLRNTPDNSSSHWMQAFVPFPEPVPVEAGELLSVRLDHSDVRLYATPAGTRAAARLVTPTSRHHNEGALR